MSTSFYIKKKRIAFISNVFTAEKKVIILKNILKIRIKSQKTSIKFGNLTAGN